MKDDVLRLLSESQGYVSGAEMSRKLGVTRAAVWKAIEALRQEGYAIESGTNRGYRLAEITTNLSRREILRRLEGCAWGEGVQVCEEVDSTSNQAKLQAAAGAPEGTVIIADTQTGGRGRLGRSFSSPKGMGMYLSAVLRPKAEPAQLLHLTCAVAVAVCNAVEKTVGVRPGVKWTNDPVIGNKKLCGILTELALEAEINEVQYAVVGIGVNCQQRQEDFDEAIRDVACSLAMATGKPVDRNLLTANCIRELEVLSRHYLTEKAAYMAQYRKDCVTVGKQVQVVRGENVRRGFALNVDDDGGLLVAFEDGKTETVSAGEVSVRGMYGYAE